MILTDVHCHLDDKRYEDLDKVIDLISDEGNAKRILISVPVLGDPNLELDPTHKIKETREWWVKKFTDKKLKEVEVPSHFQFREQLMIFEK